MGIIACVDFVDQGECGEVEFVMAWILIMPEDGSVQGDAIMSGIVIDVAGEVGGVEGVSRSFVYSKIDPTPPLVTLSVVYAGATGYAWEIIGQPEGATAVLSSEVVASPTFTPTASIPGSYLLKCTVNGGEAVFTNGLAFLTQHLGLRKPAPRETNQFNSTRGWEAALGVVLDEMDAIGSSIQDAKGARRRAVKDILDCTLEPPAASEGDRYILDTSGTAHVDYGATAGDIVEYINSAWTANTPSEGWVAYVDEKNVDYRFVDDGTPTWEEVTGAVAIPDFSNQVWIDADNGSDVTGDGSKSNPFETLAAAAASIAAPTTLAEFTTSVTFHVGPGTYTDDVTLPYRLNQSIIGYEAFIAGTITWDYDLQYYDGNPPIGVGKLTLNMSSPKPLGLGFVDLITKNAAPTRNKVAERSIYLSKTIIIGSIVNDQSGTTTDGNNSGILWLYLLECDSFFNFGSARIGGVRESSNPSEEANPVYFSSLYSSVYQFLCGCLTFIRVVGTTFYGRIDYTYNPISGTGYAGEVGGNPYYEGIRSSVFYGTYTTRIGWNGVTGSQPDDLAFDAYSYGSATDPGKTLTLDNGIAAVLSDQARAVSVDNSGWIGGPLDSKENVQESLEAIIDEIARTTYDGTVQLLDSATSTGMSETVQLDIGEIGNGTAVAVEFSLISGGSTDTDLQFYDGDPSGSGVLLKEFLGLDLVASALNDNSIWYVGLQSIGALWVSVTNNTGSDSVYSLRLRINASSADNLSADNSGWSGNLSTETTVQAALDTLDGLSLVGELSDLSDIGDTTKGNGRLMISDTDSFKSKAVSGAITIDETGATAINATPKTVADDADLLLIYDDTTSLYKQMTRANFLSGVGAPTIYDDTTTFTDVAASSSDTQELDIGAIDDGICEAVQLTITAGTSADTTIQLYNGDPGGGGSIIYEVPNLDLVTAALDDRNCWYVDLPTTGELWVKITNDGASISSYSLRLRVKGDA